MPDFLLTSAPIPAESSLPRDKLYLTITAELLESANQRFNHFAAPLLKEVTP